MWLSGYKQGWVYVKSKGPPPKQTWQRFAEVVR